MTVTQRFDEHYDIITTRDARYDDLFFFAVTSTGIYCRPSCPARRPLRKNCLFFDLARQAESHGFRPCKRCRPDRRKDHISASVINQINDADLSEGHYVGEFARNANLSERHLRRLIKQQTGTNPSHLMQIKRLEIAKRLLVTTELPIITIAFRAEFSSIRQFNQAFKQAFTISPRQFRKNLRQPYTLRRSM